MLDPDQHAVLQELAEEKDPTQSLESWFVVFLACVLSLVKAAVQVTPYNTLIRCNCAFL